MLTRQIAIVPHTTEVGINELHRVSAAISTQLVRDFSKIWNITATIDPFADPSEVPLGYWKVAISPSDTPGDDGFHSNSDNQPAAFVRYADNWSVRVSHEILEMLADPSGNSTIAGPSLQSPGSTVEYLVEVCDPCEKVSYPINDVDVSDFCTPRYYDTVLQPGSQYSFTGAIKEPHQVLDGGYVTWRDPTSKQLWQLQKFTGNPQIVPVDGGALGTRSLREYVDFATRRLRQSGFSGRRKPRIRKARTKRGDRP